MRVIWFAIATFASLALPAAHDGVRAQDDALPYWVSLKVDRANMRVGPDRSYPIEWVYVREGLPLKVVRRSGGWRLVEDQDGARGWMLARFLSRDRNAVVVGTEYADIRDAASDKSKILWRAEPNVIARLGDCEGNWCAISIDDRQGWIATDRIWGAGAP